MRTSIRIFVLATLAGAASCSAEKKDVDTAQDTSASVPAAATPAPAPPPTATQPVSEWKVTEFGIGPLRAGMATREAVAALQAAGVGATADSSKACHYLRWSGPAAVAVMLDAGMVARIEVGNPDIATTEGAKIGDAESQIQSLYPNRVTVQPHKYTKGHYLVVAPAAASDTAYRIVFETDGQKVTNYRAGKQPQVSYVEGCA